MCSFIPGTILFLAFCETLKIILISYHTKNLHNYSVTTHNAFHREYSDLVANFPCLFTVDLPVTRVTHLLHFLR